MVEPSDGSAPGTIQFNELSQRPLDVIGWREWVALPDVGVRRIKAKIDTGAKSSAIHAYNIRVFSRGGTEIVAFDLHPRQRNDKVVVSAEAEVLEFRRVRNSGGMVTTRPVIVTHAALFGRRFPIELTLANRDEMGYRMLLGREAIRGRFLVDVDQSYRGQRNNQGRFDGLAENAPPETNLTYISVDEAAAALELSGRQVRNLCAKLDWFGTKMGDAWVITAQEMERMKITPRPKPGSPKGTKRKAAGNGKQPTLPDEHDGRDDDQSVGNITQ